MAARCSDIASHTISDLSWEKTRTGLAEYFTIWQRVTRYKTTTDGHHPVVPHRDQFLLCYLFSLSYTFVVNGQEIAETGHIFPSFSTKIFNKDSEVESKVSQHYNTTIDMIWRLMTEFFSDDDENIPSNFRESMQRVFIDSKGKKHSKVRSHGNKRFAVSTLQEHLSPHTFVSRCGFAMKNLHSMFDYFFNSKNQELTCAHTIAGWTCRVNGQVQGGIAPDITALKTARHKLPAFVKTLFRR